MSAWKCETYKQYKIHHQDPVKGNALRQQRGRADNVAHFIKKFKGTCREFPLPTFLKPDLD